MNRWLYLVIGALCAVMYLLYCRGLAVTKSIRAVLFVFRPGRDADRVTLTSCTGWVRHRGRFRESRTYAFALDAQLSGGEAEVLLLDRQKQVLLRLNRQNPAGEIALEGRERYFLRWEFRSATGKCTLRW